MVELPDGQDIMVSDYPDFKELFYPVDVINHPSLHLMVNEAINKTDVDIRKVLAAGIVVVGGNSLLPLFSEIFEEKLGFVISPSLKMRVLSAQSRVDRLCSSWNGASIMGSTGAFQSMWINQKEYNEMGNSIIDRKCIN